MSITNELRKYVKDHTNWDVALTTYPPQRTMTYYEGAMDVIADRIDAEHKTRLLTENGQMWLKGYSECHAALLEGNETLVSDLERCGWIRLPKDADGKVIRIGDVLDNTHKDGFAAKAVIGISYHPGGKACVEVDENRLRWHDPSKLRHHKQPNVEDVMVEFATDWESAQDGEDKTAVLKEYAAKLRLAESEGE